MARYSSPLVAHLVSGVLIALAYFNLPRGCTTREVRDLSRRARNWAVRYHQLNPSLLPAAAVAAPGHRARRLRFADIPQHPNVAMRHPSVFRRDVPRFIRLATRDAGAVTGLPGYVPAAHLRLNPFPTPAPVPALAGPLAEIETSRAVRSFRPAAAHGGRTAEGGHEAVPVRIEHLSSSNRVLYNWLPEFLIALGALHRK